MNTSLTRKKFLINSGIAVAGMLCGRDVLRAQPGTTALVPSRAPWPQSADNVRDFPEHDPQIDRARVKRFVIAGHFNLPAVEKMLAGDPMLINGAVDWGNGDFENALGGASHMGRRDIAEFLLAHNARVDIFAATMLGKIDIVKAAVTGFEKSSFRNQTDVGRVDGNARSLAGRVPGFGEQRARFDVRKASVNFVHHSFLRMAPPTTAGSSLGEQVRA